MAFFRLWPFRLGHAYTRVFVCLCPEIDGFCIPSAASKVPIPLSLSLSLFWLKSVSKSKDGPIFQFNLLLFFRIFFSILNSYSSLLVFAFPPVWSRIRFQARLSIRQVGSFASSLFRQKKSKEKTPSHTQPTACIWFCILFNLKDKKFD